MWAIVHEVIRLAVAATLLVGGASKLVSPRPLAASLREVYGLAESVGAWVGRAVATVELAASFALAVGWGWPFGPASAAVVGLGILVFAATAMHRRAITPCGCFGESSGRPIGVRNVLAGAGLLAGALLLLVPWSGVRSTATMLALTAAAAVLAVLVRDRARLLAPFRSHFAPPSGRPVLTRPEES